MTVGHHAYAAVPLFLTDSDPWHTHVFLMALILIVAGLLASMGLFTLLVISPIAALVFRQRAASCSMASAGEVSFTGRTDKSKNWTSTEVKTQAGRGQ